MKPIVISESRMMYWRTRIMLARSSYLIEKTMRETRLKYPWMFR